MTCPIGDQEQAIREALADFDAQTGVGQPGSFYDDQVVLAGAGHKLAARLRWALEGVDWREAEGLRSGALAAEDPIEEGTP